MGTQAGRIAAAAIVVALGGCSQPPPEPAPQPEVGRYQYAGKREYNNGTEIYYLDTVKGRVCYGFITNTDKPDTNRCTDSMLTMGLD